MFDAAGRVTKLFFVGEANPLPSLYIPSDRPVLFGLSGRADEAAFRGALGSPVAETQEGAGRRRRKRMDVIGR